MTEKEEMAIETFKHWIEYEKANKEKINKADELIEIQETVLKALEQKDKEISELKEKYYKDTHTLQNQLDVANADRVEKDKIINEMAGEIAALNYEFIGDWCKQDECEKFKRNENHSRECDTNNHNCIKQYFEKKVRNKYE